MEEEGEEDPKSCLKEEEERDSLVVSPATLSLHYATGAIGEDELKGAVLRPWSADGILSPPPSPVLPFEMSRGEGKCQKFY